MPCSRFALVLAFALLISPLLVAQEPEGANWKLAQRYRNASLRNYSYDSRVRVAWIGDSELFWYRFKTSAGTRYWVVDPEARTKRPLFDHEALAASLSEELRIPQLGNALDLQRAKIDEEGKELSFRVEGKPFVYDLKKKELRKGKVETKKGGKVKKPETTIDSLTKSVSTFFSKRAKPDKDKKPRLGQSPDGQISVFTKDFNIYIVKSRKVSATEASGEKVASATDAKKIDAKKIDAKKVDAKKVDAKKVDTKKIDAKKAETEEKVDAKKIDAKKVDTKKVDAKKVDDKKVDAKKVDAKKVDAKKAETEEKAVSVSSKAKAVKRRWSRGWRFSQAKAVQLSKDGAEKYYFGSNRSKGKKGLGVTWNPDSTAFYTTRSDSRGVQDLFLVDSLGDPRPKLKTYSYAMPGEDKIRHRELHVYHRKTGKLQRVKSAWKDESYMDTRWIGGELRVLRRDRLRRNVQYGRVNPETAEFEVLFEEGFEKAYYEVQVPRYLDEKKGQFIWWSERSGWGHFYLYDLAGKCLGAVTKGAFRASRIVSLDEKKGILWFRGNGREAGENPYNEHLYRVRLDGSDLRLLNPGNENHQVQLSKSRRFIVDTASRVDQEPRVTLCNGEGRKIMDLEVCDLSRLKAMGWKHPETFSVKAADGVTDLYGNMWKPFDFDPKKRYPIIVYVYPGPQQEGVTRSFSATSARQELAQLGFIVIQVGHRGGSPKRSKAYASYGYFNLRDYGLADKRAAIEELAARHSWIDVERVGIYGHSGGGFMTAAALLREPYNDFFKVGVSSAGNHDNNIYNHSWSERYHGLKKGKKGLEIHIPTNAELAANLKGRLLLVHGEIDNNVHPAGTMRLVDALIKARKRFDLLIIPGARHSFGKARDYFTQRMYEYFSQHLLGDRLDGADIQLKMPARRRGGGA